MPVRSFRGKISSYDATVAGSGIDTITLHTNDGSTGYKIVKFQLMQTEPGEADGEHIVKIFTIPQTEGTRFVDFADNTLLGAGFTKTDASEIYADTNTVIFDNMTFNQDIYVTHIDVKAAKPVNYYIELEQVKLSLDENTVATLKDIRNIEAQNV
tara:strand:- start:19 stop:483 length:465 start_codon:yes stop_codon:yes gene_type:complete